MMLRRTSLFLCLIVVFVAGVLPLFIMLWQSLFFQDHPSLFYYYQVFASHRTWLLLFNSLELALWTTLFSLLLGTPFGVLLGRTDLFFARFFLVLFAVPLALPPFVLSLGWFYAFTALLGGVPGWFSGLSGSVFVMVQAMMPVVVILTATYTRTIDPRLEDAARLRAGWFRVIARITLVLASPGIAFAGLLVFLMSFAELGVPLFLRYDVFSVESFSRFSAFYNFKAGTAACVPVITVVLLALLVERLFLRKRTYQMKAADGLWTRLELGPWRWPLSGLTALTVFSSVILPLAGLFARTGSLSVYLAAFNFAGPTVLRSVVFAAIGAFAITLLGFITGEAVHRNTLRYSMSLDSLLLFLFALPGTVIGIGLIATYNHSWLRFIYTTPLVLFLGYIASYAAIGHRITLSSLAQVSRSFDDAARVMGVPWFRRVIFVNLPLIKKGLVAGWVVSYIFLIKDIDITMLVYPPGYDTLSVRVLTTMANGAPGLVAALCLVMVLISLVPPGLVGLWFWRRA